MIEDRKLVNGVFIRIDNHEDKLYFNDVEFNSEKELENYVRENFDLDVIFGTHNKCDEVIYIGKIIDSNFEKTATEHNRNCYDNLLELIKTEVLLNVFSEDFQEIENKSKEEVSVKLKGTKYEGLETINYTVFNKHNTRFKDKVNAC